MNIRKRNTFLCIITALLVIVGSFLMGTSVNIVEASDATPISEKVLSVKVQLSKDKTKLRMVTTLDEYLQYKNVGFEVEFIGDDDAPTKTKSNLVKTVYRRIASQDKDVTYEFGPKAFNAKSEWIATYTIINIPQEYQDNGIIIKPYVTMKDTLQKVYGEHRYLTMLDQDNDVVSLAVKGELTNPSVADATVKETYYDGTYTHVRVNATYSSLPSVSKYTVTDGGTEYTARYRYLHSTVANDQSWYNNSEADDKVIVTVGDMRGLQELAKTNNFASDTIYLGADIDLNLDWTASATSPGSGKDWTPIGYYSQRTSDKMFAGIFDGNMHTISGIYISKYGYQLGLFGVIDGATIKNFELKNSYIETKQAPGSEVLGEIGSVVGRLNGTLYNVKSDAIVSIPSSNITYNGGLAGNVTEAGSRIENCCFAGSITGAGGTHQGTLLGGLRRGNTTVIASVDIINCVSTGEINYRGNVGGLVGSLWNNAKITMTDCIFAGDFIDVSASVSQKGLAIGNATNGVATISNVYAKKSSLLGTTQTTIGNPGSNSSQSSKVVVLDTNQILGNSAYSNMELDFCIEGFVDDATWTAIENKAPQLTIFADTEEPADITKAQGTRTYWYDEENPKSSYILHSPADLRGFQELSATNDFQGVEIKLANDIDLSPQWEAGATAPENGSWTPISTFAGTFDGGMHTISGVYVKGNQAGLGLFKYVSGTVENLILDNSYIENTSTSGTCSTGSIAGELAGTLSTIKSSAMVVLNGAEYAGGLAGRIVGSQGGTITNCWFAGSVTGTGANHGTLLGGVNTSSVSGYIDNCLSTGEIQYLSNTGGLVGAVWNSNASLKITDTLFAGQFTNISGSVSNISNIFGRVYKGIIDVSNVYIQDGSGVSSSWGYVYGDGVQTISDNYEKLTPEKLKGNAAFGNMNVGFYEKHSGKDGAWFAIEDSYPILTSFADKSIAIDLTTAQGSRTYWFDNENVQSSYTLYSPAELRGFQELSETNDFEGIEIKLGKDIDLSPQWEAGATAPDNGAWTPISTFAGTFDGGMHTISGVYVKGNQAGLGLFKYVSGTVENLILDNSYIENTSTSGTCSTGSIAGELAGTLSTIKSSAMVVLNGAEYAGGLAGRIVGSQGGTITNCWFAGSVTGTGANHGTLLGGVNTSSVSGYIDNCLSTGEIQYLSNTGGLVGAVWNSNASLKITDTLFAGQFTNISGSVSNISNIFGRVYKGIIDVSNVYIQDGSGVSSSWGYVYGDGVQTKADDYTKLTSEQINGNAAYGYMYLDFYEKDKNSTGVWLAVEDSYPILTSFADTSNPVTVTVDTYWFDGNQTSYTLDSVAEFRGFQKLAAKNNFHNIEIKLGTNIDLNSGWEAGETAPTTVWTPIGRLATNADSIIPFRGTFNGQGHTIKGIYVNSGSDRIGLFAATGADAVIKDFTLENSYIKSTKDSNTGAVGSVVGRLGGTLDTIKSSAIVKMSGAQYAGGLVGDINTMGAIITNCWFDGSVSGAGGHHALLLGGVQGATTCDITHCLATGTIAFGGDTGGLVGTVWDSTNFKSTLSISDTLFAGEFVETDTSKNHGAVVGNARNGKVTVTNVYVQKGCGIANEKILGNVKTDIGEGQHNETQKANVTYVEKEGLYLDDARENTALTIYPQGQDTSSDGNNKQYWWYVSETQPVLASFGTPVTYDKLKVSTYNIGYGRKHEDEGVSSDVALPKVAEFINENKIDVCILQEVNGQAQCNEILKSLPGYYCYYQEADTHWTHGSIGIAIISKYEIVGTSYKLITGGSENRVLLKAYVDRDADGEGDL